MSIFGKITSAIFGSASAASATSSTTAPSTAGVRTSPVAAPTAPIDVEAVLTKLANQSKEKFDWQKSIVDLMKLLSLDSSSTARKELARELHYSGDMNDSAAMNVWLHQQVMQKLAEHGGKVPDLLKS
jgi:predicted Zn-dependent peptidase